MVLAKMAGQQNGSQIADWVAHHLERLVEMKLLPRGKAPSHMTYRRVNQNIVDGEALEQLVRQYQQKSLRVGEELVLSVDGKTVRGTIPSGETKGVHLLAVYVPDQGLVLAQVAVGVKENEIKQAPQLLSKCHSVGSLCWGMPCKRNGSCHSRSSRREGTSSGR